MAERPRILLITRNLPPLVGGMERLNWHMAEELATYADVCVIGPTGSAGLAPAGVKVVEVPLRPLWRFLVAAQCQAVKVVRRWRPDVILAGSGLTALPAWLAGRFKRIRTAAYVHGLDLVVSHPIYRSLWFPALRRMDCIIANSHATSMQAENLRIPRSRISIVHPGVQMPSDDHIAGETGRFRTLNGLGEDPLILSVGRLSARKGLLEFVLQSMPRIVEACPKIMLLVVGGAPSNALHACAQPAEAILKAAEHVGVAHCIRFLGQISDEELGTVYRAANVHVFPVKEIPGDPEGFGMVAVEAAAHGLPTAAFATGGVTDAVADGVSGRLVKTGDYAALGDAVLELLAQGGAIADTCRMFAGKFAWHAFGRGVASAVLQPSRTVSSASWAGR